MPKARAKRSTETERLHEAQARAAAEKFFHNLLDAAPDAILEVDSNGRIVRANATVEKLFGYSSAELLNQPVERLIPEEARRVHMRHRAGYAAHPTKRPMGSNLDLYGLRKDGSRFPVDIVLSPFEIDGGEVHTAAIVRDVTNLQAMLVQAHETERRSLARELHDDLTQKLVALSMQASVLSESSPESPDAISRRIRELGQKIGGLADDVHQISRQLHPAILDDLGLEAALREECMSFSQRLGIPVRFKAEDVPRSLPGDIALCLFRVAQESLRNIGKHAEAKEVRVRLAGGKAGLALFIEDIGNGFDIEQARGKGGLGLISMEERVRLVNGDFKIRSRSGVGTEVEVHVPLPEKAS